MKKLIAATAISAIMTGGTLITSFADVPQQDLNVPEGGNIIGTQNPNVKYRVATFQYSMGSIIRTVEVDSSTVVAYGYTTSGFAVELVQGALKTLGYNPGSIDGYFGPNTQNAVKNFQRANGLDVDGSVGPKTWTKLGDKCKGKVIRL